MTALTLPNGLRVLRPEVELLYKAKGTRPKDELDFEPVLPHPAQAGPPWLGRAVRRSFPAHPWPWRVTCGSAAPPGSLHAPAQTRDESSRRGHLAPGRQA